MARLPNVAAFTQVPDWICETISPSTGAIDRGRKMRLEGERWIVASTHGGTDPVRAETFDAVTLDPSSWWLELEPAA